MLRSFAYAADAGQWEQTEDGMQRGEVVRADLESSARNWQFWTSAAFLREYLDAVGPQLIPSSREDLTFLLDVFLLEKAVYQLGHELRTRPSWVGIPLRGLQHLLTASDPARDWLDA
jgi:maltose alpha-D-glucosyltransferase / alpha-amylase